MSGFEEALRDLESRTPSRMAPDLSRIRALADHLGDPQLTYPSVHITGTNGKTSTARMVTALFGALGVQAGTYTSPHLQTIRERIRVAGEPIAPERFAEVHAGVAPVADLVDARRGEGEDRVTYFELLTAMAYWWFADHPVDVGVFEVGMGGTWDATNLVRGEVAVITRVELDHPELGGTPAAVAEEKAGIVKPGSVVVSAEQRDDVAPVLDRAVDRNGARLLLLGRDVAAVDRRLAVGGQVVTLVTPTRRYPDVFVPLHGRHQADNAALAVGALHAFLGGLADVDDGLVQDAFGAVEVPGRLEVVGRDPTVVLDGAHNPAGAQRTAEAVGEEFAFRDVILVVGCLQGKDLAGVLAPFREVASHVIVTTPPPTRVPGVPVDELAAVAREVWSGTSVAIEAAATVAEAVEKATGVTGPSDGVVVTGSLSLVGAARDVLVPADVSPAGPR